MSVRSSVRVEQAGSRGEDRAVIYPFADSTTVVLADGAGGTTGGAEAADLLITTLAKPLPPVPVALCDALLEADTALDTDRFSGTAACALLCFDNKTLAGAVVGDVDVFRISGDSIESLVEHRDVKSTLGRNECWPASFEMHRATMRVLLCSDGLWKYIKRKNIVRAASIADLDTAADALVNETRLPNGTLQDDVSVVLLEFI